MHPLAARWESDRHVVIFFRADEKVDFRKLVRELSRLLHARIELRQVGPREQGKLCGLVGKCGYPLCCQTFLGQFAQSTIKMAKTQELALNPMKISGVCGRLLCCLNYEQEMYLDAKSRMPRVNRTVDTEFGPGRVVAVNVLKETVTVQLETMTKELRPDQIRPSEVQG
jgi:cell fate regulator YaaT (PSP1 superfamily)